MKMRSSKILILIVSIGVLGGVWMTRLAQGPPVWVFLAVMSDDSGGQVVAMGETAPTRSASDESADDLAIWIHPTDPTQSLIIGTDKKAGLGIYTLAGEEVQFLADGEMNNVDVRYNFPLGETAVALVTVTNRTNDSIAVYRVDPNLRRLENVAPGTLSTGITVYGTCMYHSPLTGKYYVYITSKAGEVEQWELFDNGSAQVNAVLVRRFDVGSKTESCVADDELADFYIGEENQGIWKYGAEPKDGEARTQVDTTASDGHLTADVEGLTLYYASDGTGYLIASSQGSDEYVVYEREGDNDYVMTFSIVAGNGIDDVTATDGIDVTNFPLGPAFPQGMFVAHDDQNEGGENYKLVPWQTIANLGSPALTIDTTRDPRQIGGDGTISQGPSTGIWISAKELASLPASGPAWEQLKAAADAPLGYKPNLTR